MKCEKWTDQAWNKEKIWVPDRNWTYDLPNTGRALYPLSYEKSWGARSFNWVHMWQAPCTLLGSTLSKSSRVWKVNKERRPSVREVTHVSSISVGDSHVFGLTLMSCWSVLFSKSNFFLFRLSNSMQYASCHVAWCLSINLLVVQNFI